MPAEAERQALEKAIAAMEAQRAALGDGVVETALAALRDKITRLDNERQGGEGQRKQVTALIADVAGYTALSASMDAGAVRDLMDALWQHLDTVVRAHQGTINQHIGDALVALWGVPAAHDNDHEQAVRAALGLQAALNGFNTANGQNLALRIGVHTGLALVQVIHSDETPSYTGKPAASEAPTIKTRYSASGEPLLGADCLQRAAPVGGILISHETYRHLRGVFSVEPAAEVTIKGRAAPVQTYQVKRAYPRAFRLELRGIEGIETRMIGRDVELAALQQAFVMTFKESKRQVVTVSGEAGVGKTRLVFEFEKWLDLLPQHVIYYKGRAGSENRSVPFSLIRDLLFFRFQINDSDRPETVREKLEAGIAAALGEESTMQAHFIGHLLGIHYGDSPFIRPVLKDSRQVRDRAVAYLHEYFDAISAGDPTVVLLEDIHWADESSLDLVESLTRIHSRQRLLMVCTARPVLYERRPDWGQDGPFHSLITLQPLNGLDSRRLVEDILQRVAFLPPALSEMIARSAGGNPFYVEELIKMLIEDGVILKETEERWRVQTERLVVARVPATLEGVLQARLDSLPAGERGTLQRAAVVGPVFWEETLAYLDQRMRQTAQEPTGQQLAGQIEAGINAALNGLAAKEMVYPRDHSAFDGTREFTFRHNMLREVAYQGMLKRERRAYHARVAEWLAGEIERSGRAGEYAALIAEHYDQAGDADTAVTWYQRSGERAASRFGNAEAVRCFTRALALTPESDTAARFSLLLAREKVYDLLAERQPQQQDLNTLTDLATRLRDPLRQAEVALRRASYGLATSDYPAALEATRQATELLDDADPEASGGCPDPRAKTALRARALVAWAHALYRLGRLSEAREKLESSLAIAYAAESAANNLPAAVNLPAANDLPETVPALAVEDLRPVEAECLRQLGIVANDQGDFAGAKPYFEQALRIYRALLDRQGESSTLASLGNLEIDLGDHAAARVYHAQSLEIKREIGDRRGEARALGNLGFIASDQGDFGASTRFFEQARSLFHIIGDRQGESLCLVNLGNDALSVGRYDAARTYQEQALLLQREVGDRPGESIALDNLSVISHHLGYHALALEYSQQSLAIVRETGLRHVEGFALDHMGLALTGLGRYAEAAQAYQKALDLRQELGEPILAVESQAGLSRVALLRGEVVAALAHAQEIYTYLQTGSVDGMIEPLAVYLTCYQGLRAGGDPRAGEALKAGYACLQDRAQKIPDAAARESFLKNVEAHRKLVELYEARK